MPVPVQLKVNFSIFQINFAESKQSQNEVFDLFACRTTSYGDTVRPHKIKNPTPLRGLTISASNTRPPVCSVQSHLPLIIVSEEKYPPAVRSSIFNQHRNEPASHSQTPNQTVRTQHGVNHLNAAAVATCQRCA